MHLKKIFLLPSPLFYQGAISIFRDTIETEKNRKIKKLNSLSFKLDKKIKNFCFFIAWSFKLDKKINNFHFKLNSLNFKLDRKFENSYFKFNFLSFKLDRWIKNFYFKFISPSFKLEEIRLIQAQFLKLQTL